MASTIFLVLPMRSPTVGFIWAIARRREGIQAPKVYQVMWGSIAQRFLGYNRIVGTKLLEGLRLTSEDH